MMYSCPAHALLPAAPPAAAHGAGCPPTLCGSCWWSRQTRNTTIVSVLPLPQLGPCLT